MNSDCLNLLFCSQQRRAIIAIRRALCVLTCMALLGGCVEQPTVLPAQQIANQASPETSPTTKLPPASAQASPASHAETPTNEPKAEPQFDPDHLKFGMVTIGTASEPGLGYGVVLDRSSTGFDVITADHVLADRQSLVVHAWQADEKATRLQAFSSVTIMHRSPVQDLAWLRVRGNPEHVLPLALAKQNATDQQFAWTYHIDKTESIFELNEIEKRVSAKRTNQSQAVSYWRLTKRIEPGLSGGGLVDVQGQWIGIASGNSQDRAHYIDLYEINKFLRDAGLR